jgi:hypothetical protein
MITDYDQTDIEREDEELREQRIEEDIDRHIEAHGSEVPYGAGGA